MFLDFLHPKTPEIGVGIADPLGTFQVIFRGVHENHEKDLNRGFAVALYFNVFPRSPFRPTRPVTPPPHTWIVLTKH